MFARRHEHEFEPVRGLPERLPESEHILWQGTPDARWMARRVFHMPLVAGYFALLLSWQGFVAWHDGTPWRAAAAGLASGVALAALAIGLLALLSALSARTTVYTLTNRRVVMRVGIVLTVTYNLPLRCIDAANVHPLVAPGQRGHAGAAGHGDLALVLRPDTRIAYLHLWPHARPWHLRRTQPMLRCLPNVQEVAELLGNAWSAANAQPAVAQPAPASGTAGHGLQPALPSMAAGH